MILDNHTVHTSQKIKQYLKTMPGRFEKLFVSVQNSSSQKRSHSNMDIHEAADNDYICSATAHTQLL